MKHNQERTRKKKSYLETQICCSSACRRERLHCRFFHSLRHPIVSPLQHCHSTGGERIDMFGRLQPANLTNRPIPRKEDWLFLRRRIRSNAITAVPILHCSARSRHFDRGERRTVSTTNCDTATRSFPSEPRRRYSCEMMAKIVFDGQTYAGSDDCLPCFGETGEQVSHTVVVSACGILLELDVPRRLVCELTRPDFEGEASTNA